MEENERKEEKSYLLVLEVKFSLWKNHLFFCTSPWNCQNLYGNKDVHVLFVLSRRKENVKIQKLKVNDRDSEVMELTGGENMSSISRESYATLYVSVKYIYLLDLFEDVPHCIS